MSRPFIVIGDQTDHGGVVVGSTMTTDTHGKRLARVGDQVTCPKKGHGTNGRPDHDRGWGAGGAPWGQVRLWRDIDFQSGRLDSGWWWRWICSGACSLQFFRFKLIPR